MNKANKNNRIIFLTTLSVYLGLVLVGAPPSVLGQKVKQNIESNKISILAPSLGYVFTFDLNPLIELNKLAHRESGELEVSGNLIPRQQKSTDWKIITSSGSAKFVDFVREEFFAPLLLDPATLVLVEKEFFQSVKVDKDSIITVRNTKFNNAVNAEEFANSYQHMIEYAKSPAAKKEIAGNLILTNTQVSYENNQVFIVTRLPRGSLDELLKQDAKADGK